MEKFSGSCCLASCYGVVSQLKLENVIPDNETLIHGLWRAYFAGYLDDDAEVKDADKLLKFWSGKKAVVTKVEDKIGIAELLNSKEVFIAMHSYHTGSDATKIGHFVVHKGSEIIFNSLDYSKNVAIGVVTSIRKITWV